MTLEPKPEELQQAYRLFTEQLASGQTDHVSLAFDECGSDFDRLWQGIYGRIKDTPNEASMGAERLIQGHPKGLALALAMARMDAVALFPHFKKFLEQAAGSGEGLAGYLSVSGVPGLYAGFLYMTACVMALSNEKWAVLKQLLTGKFEWRYMSGRPHYSYGFSHPLYFHSDALGRAASHVHDFYRKMMDGPEVSGVLHPSGGSLLDWYLRAQFLMCLKGAKSISQGENLGMWADFGRFYSHRIEPLLTRAEADAQFGQKVAALLDETTTEFFSQLNDRLKLIHAHFWGPGSNYLWESITRWPSQS